MSKKISVSAVREAAHQLMKDNGTTTTLEVKLTLRQRGFWAVQMEVSAIMEKVAAQEDWFWQCNGRFRQYARYPEMMPNVYAPMMHGTEAFRLLFLN
ncbi:MAG TPA: hypothetical protein PLL64_07160 [Rhodothermales bacterium]|nr:hypothetical protein [Rhodothermales bacterium]HRR08283.1 hypothetical protein [Rhodothermales bacterium]